MFIVSKPKSEAYSIGVCPEFLNFVSFNHNLRENKTPVEMAFKRFEEKGLVREVDLSKKEPTLTLILKEDGKVVKEVELEVDHLQCIFLLSHLEEGMTEKGCRQPCCELPCCIVKKLTAKLS